MARILEIGSGNGQHAATLAGELDFALWQTSDHPDNIARIERWLDHAGDPRLPAPLALVVGVDDWPDQPFDTILTVNTLHIMSRAEASRFLQEAAAKLETGGTCFIYGPFRIGGDHTSPGNAEFDASLRSAPGSTMGLRDLDEILAEAADCGLAAVARYAMPANNRMVVLARADTASDRIAGIHPFLSLALNSLTFKD